METRRAASKTPLTARPHVVCHMMISLDGRIVTGGWPLSKEQRGEYEAVHASYEADGWMVGRVTMRHFADAVRSDEELARRHDGGAREDFVASGHHDSFAFAVDPRGRLVWHSHEIDGDHVVVVCTRQVSDDYLATLRAAGVSYVLAGEGDEVDLPRALERIGTLFGVRTLMLEGGGGINGSMLRAGLVDEVSVLLAPVADGRTGTAALFDVHGAFEPRALSLESVERRSGDVLWLRYLVKR